MSGTPKRTAIRVLAVLAPTVLVVTVIETLIAAVARWPHQFAGHGDPGRVWAELAGSGTALSPPLFLMVILALCAYGVQRVDGWRRAAVIGLIPLSVALVIGSLGEALATRSPAVPAPAQVVGGVVAVGLSLALLALAVVVALRRGDRQASAAVEPTQHGPG